MPKKHLKIVCLTDTRSTKIPCHGLQGLLKITKNASAKDLKKAYRKLAAQYHSNKNPDDKNTEEKFKEINDENSVLSDVKNT